MTAFDYSKLASTALDLVTRFGVAGKLNKRTTRTYSQATGVATPVSPAQHDLKIFETSHKQVKENDVVKHVVEAVIGASGLSVSIESGDMVTYGGKTYQVLDPGALDPGGTVVVYEATLEA